MRPKRGERSISIVADHDAIEVRKVSISTLVSAAGAGSNGTDGTPPRSDQRHCVEVRELVPEARRGEPIPSAMDPAPQTGALLCRAALPREAAGLMRSNGKGANNSGAFRRTPGSRGERVVWRRARQRPSCHSGDNDWRLLLRWAILCALIVSLQAPSMTRAESEPSAKGEGGSLPGAWHDPFPEKISVVEGRDIRRLSGSAGLSETRVAWVVRDNLGFIWFGTQYGLNRFDGYKSKVFKHQPGRSDTLSCVYNSQPFCRSFRDAMGRLRPVSR